MNEELTILETREVCTYEDGSRAEWRLLLTDVDAMTTQWKPFIIKPDEGGESSPLWLPLPGSQFLFFNCPIAEVLYEGTRGPGKTMCMAVDFAKDVDKGYGSAWRGILFRREYKDLDDIVRKMEDIFPKMYPGWRFLHSKSEYMALWPDGAALLLRQIINEEDYKTYHGHEYPWIGFEELTEWENDIPYMLMHSCNRPPIGTNKVPPTRIRASCNPYGVGHNWVKKRWRLPEYRHKVIRPPGEIERVAIHGALYENFLVLHADPTYPIKVKNAASNPAQARAWLTGDWNVTSGGMIDDLWMPSIHVLPDFDAELIPRSWTITRAYDHGSSAPFSVGWWLESSGESITLPDGREIGAVRGDLILFAEWYGCKLDDTGSSNGIGLRMSSKKIAQGIVDREEDLGLTGRVRPGPADTQIYNKESDRRGRSPADDMAAKGVDWFRADKSPGSRKRGWQLLRTRLEDAYPDRMTGVREAPGVFVCLRCRHWIDLVPPMPRDKKDLDEVPDTYEDHAGDMTRYRLNWEFPGMSRRGFGS